MAKDANVIRAEFERCIAQQYLDAMLKEVREMVENANQHADYVGIYRTTTGRWWRSHRTGDYSKLPLLRTFLLTLAAFDIDCGKVFPESKEVRWEAWRQCMGYVATGFNDEGARPLPTIEEIYCINIVTHGSWGRLKLKVDRLSDELEASKGSDGLGMAQAKDALDDAKGEFGACTSEVLSTLRSLFRNGTIRAEQDIISVIDSWLNEFLIVAEALKGEWLVDDES